MYRYDGLYRVTDHWSQEGKAGFLMRRYRLELVEGTSLVALPPRDFNAARRIAQLPQGKSNPGRKESTTQRIVRNSQVKRAVKELHNYTCQVCALRIETATGAYAEGAHVRGLGTPHNGPDEPDNVLCLCPNHHVMFDYGMLAIADDGTVSELDQTGSEIRRHTLTTHPDHKVNPDHLAYHRQHYAIGEVR